MCIENLQKELRAYYRQMSFHTQCGGNMHNYRNPLWPVLDEYAALHPECSAIQLKAAQYEIIAENFKPVIFKNSPFYSEMGISVAESDGLPWLSAGGWLLRKNHHLFKDINPSEHTQYVAASKNCIHMAYGPYADLDHHCCSYSNILENGLSHYYELAKQERENCISTEEQEFIEAAMRGLNAVRKIACKFADAAEMALHQTNDPVQKSFLSMIAQTAKEIPWRKPGTFYEALCTIWFMHEVGGVIDGVRIYVLGHLDRMLGKFYNQDIDAGRLTYDEAYDLVCRFLCYTDCKFDSSLSVTESYNYQEMGGTLILGGCDEKGETVCNDITFMVLRAHHELKMIYPKLHCRISKDSPQEYLDAINRDFVSGRNVISFLSDDCIIPAQVKAGKRLEDARCYVAGGCWEIMLEGYEHSAGANCKVNLARIMDMSIHNDQTVVEETGVICDKLDGTADFEEVYRIVIGNVIRIIRQMCMIMGKNGKVWPEVNPSPFFSSCLTDCLENRKDYTAGGGRYNPHGLPLAGFSILVDSLLAIRHLCFERKSYRLDELLEAVRANWEGYETLRAEALSLPHFGDNSQESNSIAARILDDIYKNTRDLENERGGPFQLGVYNYRDIIDWADMTRATPDGRRKGDYLTQGLTPSRLRQGGEITTVINSATALNLSQCPANSIITVNLPLGGVDLHILSALERAFAASGIGMLQLNCIDKAQLLDAREHPEKHQDLIIRLYGYSVRFVNLTEQMQDEFLSRTVYGKTA